MGTALRGLVPTTLLAPLRAAPAVRGSPRLAALLGDVERRAGAEPTAAVGVLDDHLLDGSEEPAVLLAAAGLVLQDAGWLGPSRERFAEAARVCSDAHTMAVSALGLGGIWLHEHRSALDRVQVLDLQQRALTALPESSPVAVRLRVRTRAEQAYVRGDTADLPDLLDEVRALRSPLVLAETLSTVHHCLLGPEHAATRLALAEELIAVSSLTGRRMDALLGLTWRTVDLFLAGDAHAVRSLRELRSRADTAHAACVAYVVAALDVMLAIRAGRLDEAERLAERCLELGTAVGDADATGWFGAHVVAVRWYQGRGAEVLELLSDLADSPTMAEPNEAFTSALAVAAAGAARTAEARSALERLKGAGLAAIPSSSNWLVTLFGAAEAADLLGDAAAAREAYDLLRPYAGWPVMASLGVACFGSVHRPLGVAASAFGDHDLAVTHLEAACAADLRLSNGPSALLASRRLARALRARGRDGDDARAERLEREADARAEQLGMPAGSVRASAPLQVRRCGSAWEVSAGPRVATVRHCIGMGYVAHLMERPGVEVLATELAAGHAASVSSGRQPVLDAAAKAAYRRRVDELRTRIEEAEQAGAADRSSAAQAELDQLLAELQRVTGLGGRSRAFDDDVERARTSVQKAIRRAVSAVAEVDPSLGKRLRRSISTGTRCAYLPADEPAT